MIVRALPDAPLQVVMVLKARTVVVALVEVALPKTRLVMVEVALLARMPPDKVDRPETESEVSVPTDVRDDAVTPEPSVVALSTLVPLMLYANPEARFILPDT